MGPPTFPYNQNNYPEGMAVATANDGSAGMATIHQLGRPLY